MPSHLLVFFFFNCMSARFVGWKSRYITIQIIIWQSSPGVIPSVSIGSCDFCRDFVIRKVSTETVITVFLRESRQIQNKQVLSECHVLDYLLTSFSRGVLQRRQPNIPQYDHSARFVKSYHFQFYILTNSFFGITLCPRLMNEVYIRDLLFSPGAVALLSIFLWNSVEMLMLMKFYQF